MKRLFKITITVFILISLFCVCASPVFANSVEMPEGVSDTAEDNISEGYAEIENEALRDDGFSEEKFTPGPDGEIGVIETEEEEFNNIFSTVYDTLMENSDKIFSLLAFLCSLVIAFLYKKSFMPSVKSSMQGLVSTLKGFSDDSRKEISGAGKLIEAVNERLLDTEGVLSTLSEHLERIECDLNDKKSDSLRLESIKKVISAEIDMLYDVFMSSSLPEFKKEEVGERVRNMKKELSENDTCE